MTNRLLGRKQFVLDVLHPGKANVSKVRPRQRKCIWVLLCCSDVQGCFALRRRLQCSRQLAARIETSSRQQRQAGAAAHASWRCCVAAHLERTLCQQRSRHATADDAC